GVVPTHAKQQPGRSCLAGQTATNTGHNKDECHPVEKSHSTHSIGHIHEGRLEIGKSRVIRPDELGKVHLNSTENSRQETHQHGSPKNVALGVVHFFRE